MFPAISLHNNPWIASFQLLFWLLFQPSAWRAYVNQIDPALAPDFALGKMPTHLKNHPKLQRVQKLAFFLLPILVGVLIGLVLLIIQIIPWPSQSVDFHYFMKEFVFGVGYGTMLCLIGILLGSFTVSLPFGLIAGALGGLSLGILFGIAIFQHAQDLWSIVLATFVLSIAGNVTISLHQEIHKRTLGWQIGSFVIGIGVSLAVLVIALMTGLFLGDYILQPILKIITQDPHHLRIISMAMVIGMILGWFIKGWRWVLLTGLLFGLMMTLLIIISFGKVDMMNISIAKSFISGPTLGIVHSLLFVILFVLPYLIAQRIASVWAGIIAGILGSIGIILVIMLIDNDSPLALLTWSIVALSLGLSQKLQAYVLYPFESAWNLMLYRHLEHHPEQVVKLWRRHSAFWNERQHLRLWGLETLLNRLYEHDEAVYQQAIMQLSNGPQQWAVKATQIEANIKRLETCQTLDDIRKIPDTFIINNDLTGKSGNWLRNLYQSSQAIKNALSQRHNDLQENELQQARTRLEGIITLTDGKSSLQEQRFVNIAKKWLHWVKIYIDELQKVREIPNPYIFGPPLEEGQEVFVPRPNIDSRIKNLLNDRSSPPLLLYGQRRTGKTSLLKNLVSRLPDNFIMLFVDCQGTLSGAQDQVSFFYNLGRAMIRNAKKNYPDLVLPPLTEETVRSDPVTRFDEWLDDIEDVIGDKTILLALDEFITLDNAFNDGRLALSTILGLFRNLIQNRRHFRLLFSGTHTFEELQHWANYLINVQAVHLNYLSEDEALQLIEHPVKNFPLHYNSDATQRVMQITHNQPALVQLLCGEIVQMKEGQTVNKRLYVQIEDVELAIPMALQSGSFFFADIEQNQIDDNGRTILHFIASKGEGTFVSQEALLAQFSTDLAKTLKHLLQRELIEENEDKKSYRFQIELVRRWFFG